MASSFQLLTVIAAAAKISKVKEQRGCFPSKIKILSSNPIKYTVFDVVCVCFVCSPQTFSRNEHQQLRLHLLQKASRNKAVKIEDGGSRSATLTTFISYLVCLYKEVRK